tara:strand:- start:1800 stop:2027 length:228 start_codon:yes stop_codon:yes gene_type:complete
MIKEVYDTNCRIFLERNGRKKVWVDEQKVKDLNEFAKIKKIQPSILADYFIGLGLSTLKHNPDQKIKFDLDVLKL